MYLLFVFVRKLKLNVCLMKKFRKSYVFWKHHQLELVVEAEAIRVLNGATMMTIAVKVLQNRYLMIENRRAATRLMIQLLRIYQC